MNRRFLCGLMLALLVFGSFALAQTSKGIISGIVTDKSGAVLSGATVVAKSLDSGETRTVTTGATGGYRIDAVATGRWTITVSQSGFSSLTMANVDVRGTIVTPIDVKLEIGKAETTISVEAGNNEVQTENAELSHAIGTTEITAIPIQNLNPISLVLTEPGVVDVSGGGDRNFTNGTGFSANGLRGRSNNFLIDGQDNNDNSLQGQALQPTNANAVEQVTILTNSYSAEFGRGGSSVTNVIFKGGSNQFHGGVSELYEGSGLNAMTHDDKVTESPKARYDTHTYGFTFGGPIVKDKLFFFTAAQWQRVYGKNTGATFLAPTAAGVTALNTIGTDNAKLLLQYYNGLVASNSTKSFSASNGTAVDFGPVQRQLPQNNPDTQWNLKFDYNMTPKDVFAFRYVHDQSSYSPDFFVFSTALPGLESQQGGPGENFGTTYTRTFNPHAVNELRASYGHFGFTFAPTATTLANPLYSKPTFSIAGFSPSPTFGLASNLPQGRYHTTYQVQDALTMTTGNHVTKMGFDVSRLIIKDLVPFNSRGTIGFAAGGGYIGFANFLDNYTGQSSAPASIAYGSPEIRPRAMQEAFYLQDSWKVTPSFTVDLGVRYEFQNNPENYLPYPAIDIAKEPSNTFPQVVRVKEDGNNWSPRIGLAYTPHIWKKLFGDGKTALRAGYGIFYDSFFDNILSNTAASAPNVVSGSAAAASGRGTLGAINLVSTISPTLNPKSSVTSVDSKLVNPMVHQWNLNIQRELPGKFIATFAYVGTRGERLLANEQLNVNQGYVDTYGDAGYRPRLNANRGAIAVRSNIADSVYHGFSAKVERQMSKGLLIRSSYTWGKAIDNASEVFTITGGSSYGQTQTPGGLKQERGLSAFDVRHRWVLTYVYSIPSVPAGANGLMKGLNYVTRDWTWSGTTTLQSGVPDTFYIYGYDTDGDGNAYNNRPFMGNKNAPLTAVGIDGGFIGETPGTLYNVDTLDNEDGPVAVAANDVHFIVKPGKGNVGRNSYIGPGSVKFDMAFARAIKLPFEGHSLNFRGELYNIFNHRNQNGYVNTSVTDGSGYYGGFMDKEAAINGYRQIKLSLKYQF